MLENKLSIVKGFEFRSMGDAHDRGIGETIDQQIHHLRLAGGIQR